MILALRTDNPEAELYLYEAADKKVAQHTWRAHRELSKTLLEEIENLLHSNKLTLRDLTGIVVFRGPGSFTGLRIGITVANTLAYAQNIPVAGATGEDWITNGIRSLSSSNASQLQPVLPEYGAPVHITKPRK